MKTLIRVLYEDDSLIAFDKPAGLLSVPSPKKERHTLTSVVNSQYVQAAESRLYPCHRLDRETSGVILFARGRGHEKRMRQLFIKRAVQKTYIAFVRGQLKRHSGEIRSCIVDAHQRRFGRRRAQMAVTRFKVVSAKKDYSVLEVRPVTGRTNQVRIHFAEAGFPLLGERLYAFGRDFTIKFRRLALHASALSFPHPVYNRTVRVKSPLPEDMANFLKRH